MPIKCAAERWHSGRQANFSPPSSVPAFASAMTCGYLDYCSQQSHWSDPVMPHFTIEYSANLDDLVEMGKVVEVVRKAAVETGIFPLGGIRVRAIRCEHYALADGS